MTDFVHLHNHTDYSLLDGAASIKKYVERAKELGMDALAITDHGNMFGVLEFYHALRRAKIQPILGCEFYICPEGRFTKGSRYHLILLAMNDKGYHNLMELNSIAWIEGFYSKPRIDRQCLAEHSEGLICLSACLAGELPGQLLSQNPEKAYETAKWYKGVFGDRYYIELQNHFLEEEETVLPLLAKLARDLGIKTVCTNDIHYINKDDASAHDILLCMGTKKKKSDTDRMRFGTEEFYMKSGDEMASLFKDYPESVATTREIADRCKFDIVFPGPILPKVDVPEGYKDTKDYLTRLAWEGLARRYPGYAEGVDGDDEAARRKAEKKKTLEERLGFELSVILKMGFDSYFLIVRDYIYWAKTHGIPVGAGRGSGAGSLVAYCIDITNVDPIAHDLLFERFLNPDRISLPDFDVDFCFEGRQEVINYVTNKYGRDSVGQIATFGTLKAKAVVKDVARVLDISFDESNAITKMIPDDIKLPDEAKEAGCKTMLEWALKSNPDLQEVRARGGVYEELFDASLRLENLARHVSTHACGVVIGREPLKNYVPLYKDQKTGGISTQYTMGMLEDCGLVKMDFLGLKTLTILKNTTRLIRKHEPDFDLEKVPFDDAATYAMMAAGDSEMVFQFESPGMQKNLRLLSPTRFEELDAMTSLYRPGPMQFIPQYIDSKQGRMEINYPDPSLVDLLKPTYGVMVYQEQVMKTAQIYAGFTLGEADTLRKVMGKKKVELLPEQERKFVEGAVKNGHSEAAARELFEHIKPFAGYGFNKSHSVCYTVLSYRTAYLKCHYPAEFYAANLTNEITNSDNFKKYLEYVKSRGIRILTPDINKSDLFFNVSGGDIVYGLAGLKGLGEKIVDLILKEREENGPYKDFLDFLRRSDSKVASKNTIEALVYGGAFDTFGYNRPTLLANWEDALKSFQGDKEARDYGQNLLFGGAFGDDGVEAPSAGYKMKSVPDFDLVEKLEREKEYLGFYMSGHPLDVYRTVWEAFVRLDLSRPERFAEGVKYDLIGLVTDVKSLTTKSGSRMGYVTLEDYNGHIEVTVFPKQWALYEPGIVKGRVLGVQGGFKKYNDRMSFAVDTIYGNPAQMKPHKPSKMYIEVNQRGATAKSGSEIRSLLQAHKGTAGIEFVMYQSVDDEGNAEGRVRRIVAGDMFNASADRDLVAALKGCDGVIDVYTE